MNNVLEVREGRNGVVRVEYSTTHQNHKLEPAKLRLNSNVKDIIEKLIKNG